MKQHIFAACCVCAVYQPIEGRYTVSLHGNCKRLAYGGSCSVQQILLGEIGPTRSSAPDMTGIKEK